MLKKLLTRLFNNPSARDIALADLEHAKREYLNSVQQAEFHASMAAFYDGMIHRLSNYVQEGEQ